jgi:hypothetical protein
MVFTVLGTPGKLMGLVCDRISVLDGTRILIGLKSSNLRGKVNPR